MGLIYHYTSPEGALAILRNKKLWFTDCEYLNDPAELAYCQRLINDTWGVATTDPRTAFENVWSHSDGATISRKYVLCVSGDGDNVGLWSGFTKNGLKMGYAIGLDEEVLKRAIEPYRDCNDEYCTFDMQIGRVEYDEGVQRERLIEAKNDFDKKMESLTEDERDPYSATTKDYEYHLALSRELNDVMAFMKHPSFKYENEHRVVLEISTEFEGYGSPQFYSVCREDCSFKLHYQAGATGIITPYFEWDFSSHADSLIKEVCISPAMEADLAKRGMERLLESSGYEGVEVISSAVQLRF